MNALIPRASIYEIEAHRNRAVELFGEAFDTLHAATREAAAAAPSGSWSLPQLGEQSRRYGAGDRDLLLSDVTKVIDRGVWSHLISATGLDRLMDKTAREQFRAQLETDPPPATAENCFATMEQLVGDADTIFKRGIATAFSRLDRRFRSHDGFKVGARMVLSAMLSPDGWWNHYQRHDDTLVDIERAFAVLDGKPQPHRDGGIVGAIKLAKGSPFGARQFDAESDLFRVRVFKNGNAHLWFKRDDLVAKINALLADYYGAALGAGADVADRNHEPARTPAKNFGFFESPEAVVGRLYDAANVGCYAGVSPLTILEPSAGRGAIARPALSAGHHVTCVEIQPANVDALRGLGGMKRVIGGDFLDQSPDALGRFDVVLMNPPFDRGRDVDHVTHALKFLRPGGKLAAVMSAGVEFREDRKTADFRARVDRMDGRFCDLPPGSFAESGTNVNTCIVAVRT